MALIGSDMFAITMYFENAHVRSVYPTSASGPLLRSLRGQSVRVERHRARAHPPWERLLHHSLGTEHLLLGLLREEGSVAAEVLAARGVRIEAVREAIVLALSRGEQLEPPGPPMAPANTYQWPQIPFVPSRMVHILPSGMRFPLESFAVHSVPFRFLVHWFEEILGGQVIDDTVLPGIYGFELNERVDTPEACIQLVRDAAGLVIWIRAARTIRRGEELTYDYSIIGERTIPCRCRPGCPNRI